VDPKLLEAFDLLPDAVLGLDEAGCVIGATHATFEALGQPVGELRGRRLADLVAEDDRAALVAALAAARAQAPDARDVTRPIVARGARSVIVRLTSSQPRVVELTLGPPVPGGPLFVTARDRTLEQAERARLVASHELWRSVTENPFDFVVSVDVEGRLEFLNHTGTQSSPEKYLGIRIFDYLSPESTGDALEALRASFAEGRPGRWESHVPASDRWYSCVVTPVRHDGVVVSATVVGRDITREKQAEQAARQAEERYRQIVESTRDGLWCMDAGGRTTFMNQQLARMLGSTPEEMLGRTVFEIVHPEGREAARASFARRQQGHDEVVERRFVRKDGSDLWALVSAAPSWDERGEFAGVTALVTDLSERRRLEEQLLHAQKMEAVGRLAGGIAHEFNNLITGIVGAAELLALKFAATPEAMSELQSVRQGADRAAALVRRLLTFARKQTSSPRIVDLRDVFTSAERILASAVGEDVELDLERADLPCTARVDPAQIEQVLLNLGINARDAMPSGGRLGIAVKRERLVTGRGALPAGEYVALVVSDSGVGMTPDVRERIFEPFFTTKSFAQGSGLGLSLVYGIVTGSGGTIEVDTAPGRGTVFTIRLPFVEGSEAPEPQREPGEPPGGTETILVVEDDEMVRGITVRTLRALGYKILLAEDGVDALEVASRHRGTIDLVLTDVVMPRLGGPELVEKLRATRPDVRALFVSGYSEAALEDRGLLARLGTFLDKPYASAALAQKLREALDGPPR
jgi:PAS domain S-box-containing protein